MPARGDYNAAGGDWDIPANANYQRIDNAIGGALNLPLPSSGAVYLTADQANYQIIQPTSPAGGLLGDVHVVFPAGSAGLRFIMPNNMVNNGNWLFFRSAFDAANSPPFFGAQFRYSWQFPVAIELYPGYRCLWADYGASPPGTIKDYVGNVIPPGWLLCDGHWEEANVYDILFNTFGYSYGGSGPYFAMPDMRGLALVGADHMGQPPGSNQDMGSAGRFFGWGPNGVYSAGNTTTLIVDNLPPHGHPIDDPAHIHGVADPGHSHVVLNIPTAASGAGVAAGVGHSFGGANTSTSGTGIGIQPAATGISIGNTGNGTPLNIVQPSMTVFKIIRA